MKYAKEFKRTAGKFWGYFKPHSGEKGVEKTFAQRTYEGFQQELPKRMSVTLFGALVGAYVSRKFQERNHLRDVLDDVVSTIDAEESEFWEYAQSSDLIRKVPKLHLFSAVSWDEVQNFKEQSFELQRHIITLKRKEILYESLKERVRYGRGISLVLDALPILRWFAILGPLRHRIDYIEGQQYNKLEDLIHRYSFALHVNKGIYYHISKRSHEAVVELALAEDIIDRVDVLRQAKVAFEKLHSKSSAFFDRYPHPSLLKGESVKGFKEIQKAYLQERNELVQKNPSMGIVRQLISNFHNLQAKSFRQRAGYDLWNLECEYLELSEKAYLDVMVYDPFDPIVKYEHGMLCVDMGNCETYSGNDGSKKFEQGRLLLQDAKFLHRYNDGIVTYGVAYGIFSDERNKTKGDVNFESLENSKALFEFSLLKRRPYDSEDHMVLVNYARLLHFMGEQCGDKSYYVKALEILDIVYSENPLFPLTLLVRGEILSSLDCFDEAISGLELGLKVLSNISLEEDYRLHNHYQSALEKTQKLNKKPEKEVEKKSNFCSQYKCMELQRLLFRFDDTKQCEEPKSAVGLLI